MNPMALPFITTTNLRKGWGWSKGAKAMAAQTYSLTWPKMKLYENDVEGVKLKIKRCLELKRKLLINLAPIGHALFKTPPNHLLKNSIVTP